MIRHADTLIDVTRYDVLDRPELIDPVVVTGFDGWVNAGQAATGAAEALCEGGTPIVRFDPDDLFDYRDTRPTLTVSSGVPRSIEHPEVSIVHRRAGSRDLLIVTGTEPSLAWRSFSSTVVDLAMDWQVSEMIVLGGIPWAVPHTRPVTVITTASSLDRVPEDAEHPEGLLVVPASVNSAIELEMIERGVPTMGLYARVPNYLGAHFWAASEALVARVDSHLGLGLDLSGLATEADSQRVHLDAIAAARPDVKTMIDQLESMVDDSEAVSGDELASEIERFLRNRGQGDTPDF